MTLLGASVPAGCGGSDNNDNGSIVSNRGNLLKTPQFWQP
jgi:hypothetical protein